MAGERVFITGGASGLGRALADRYARAGRRVCVGDVREDRGREAVETLRAAGATAEFLPCDVTRDGDLETAADWLDRSWGGVDVVVNNAGVAAGGLVEDVPLDDWRWIVDVNLLGVVRGCRAFVPLMKRQGRGRLVNVASLAGLIHPPGMGPYNAAKAAVVALSETLHAELAPFGVSVSVVCPGFFPTNLLESLRAADPADRAAAERLFAKSKWTADGVADAVFRGAERGRFRILPEWDGRAAWALKRWLPFPLFSRLVARSARQA